jgi:hypothetical protein
MPEYKAPGVYVEEVERGPKTIEGVSTSVAGFVGVAERGPTQPQLVTSVADYNRKYGGYGVSASWSQYGGNAFLPHAIEGFFTNGGGRAWVTRVVPEPWIQNEVFADATLDDGAQNSPTNAMTVTANGVGFWGQNVVLDVGPASSGDSDRFSLRIGYWREEVTLSGSSYDELVKPANMGPPDYDEVYDELSASQTDSNYYMNVVDGVSEIVTLTAENPGTMPEEAMTKLSLSGMGNQRKTMNAGDYEGILQKTDGYRSGLKAFTDVDEITMVCVPDEHYKSVSGEIKDHCEGLEDRIAILQADRNADLTSSGPSNDVISEYAALYTPWLKIRDPETSLDITVPPGGHIAGIYARSDSEHGVHKAPANETVRGIRGLNRTINKAEQASLNPKGVNCIRSFRGRGIRVWGARTTSSNPSWKYVNVRRLFMYVEESIDEGTQWVVFENNDQNLWARVRQTISNFLTSIWEDGALMGSTPEEAFYVKCDRTTMSQNDIDNGRLICEIGIAPVKPAEFVIFRISQWTAGAEGGG